MSNWITNHSIFTQCYCWDQGPYYMPTVLFCGFTFFKVLCSLLSIHLNWLFLILIFKAKHTIWKYKPMCTNLTSVSLAHYIIIGLHSSTVQRTFAVSSSAGRIWSFCWGHAYLSFFAFSPHSAQIHVPNQEVQI